MKGDNCDFKTIAITIRDTPVIISGFEVPFCCISEMIRGIIVFPVAPYNKEIP